MALLRCGRSCARVPSCALEACSAHGEGLEATCALMCTHLLFSLHLSPIPLYPLLPCPLPTFPLLLPFVPPLCPPLLASPARLSARRPTTASCCASRAPTRQSSMAGSWDSCPPCDSHTQTLAPRRCKPRALFWQHCDGRAHSVRVVLLPLSLLMDRLFV